MVQSLIYRRATGAQIWNTLPNTVRLLLVFPSAASALNESENMQALTYPTLAVHINLNEMITDESDRPPDLAPNYARIKQQTQQPTKAPHRYNREQRLDPLTDTICDKCQ